MSRSYSEFITPLLRNLRGEIMAVYGKIDHELKGDLSVVTEIDKNIEKRIVEALSAKYPEIGFHGEEHGRKGSTERYWLVDPIDGTENYIRGLPGVTTILGLVENGEVTQSYIYDPVEDVVYSAFKGMGAFANDKQISVSDRPLSRSFVMLTCNNLDLDVRLAKKITEAGAAYVGKIYGSGINAVYLCSGKIDGGVTNIAVYGGPWDFAPTSFLAKEAGAILTSFDGGSIESRSYAILNPIINEELLPIIKEQIQNEN
ncbi:MAG: inositol monophosphatase family protein [Candidatus Saccharibacteria bacterium]|nr:inositol monophosphatase family protein [Candidatus Saccharibacteria bacterium]